MLYIIEYINMKEIEKLMIKKLLIVENMEPERA